MFLIQHIRPPCSTQEGGNIGSRPVSSKGPRYLSLPLPSFSSLAALLDLQLHLVMHTSNACFCLHRTILPLCISVSKFFFLVKRTVIGFRAHSNPGWPPLNLIISTNSLFSDEVTYKGTRGYDLNRTFEETKFHPLHSFIQKIQYFCGIMDWFSVWFLDCLDNCWEKTHSVMLKYFIKFNINVVTICCSSLILCI